MFCYKLINYTTHTNEIKLITNIYIITQAYCNQNFSLKISYVIYLYYTGIG